MTYTASKTSSKYFRDELYKSIRDYFKDNNISKYADGEMRIKLALALVWWLSSITLLFTVKTSGIGFFFLYAFHTFSQLFILLNIAHDANHSSIFKNRKLSKALRYSFDICGVNSYMWRQLHHAQHHYCMNIAGEDESLVARGLFRVTKKTKLKFIHRFQHLYFFIFYGLFTTDWVFTKDFECFFFPYTTYLKQKKHPLKEYVKLFLFKLFYIGYMIFLPVFLLHYSAWLVIVTFLVCHFMIGLIGGTVIQITHPLHSAAFPESHDEYEHFAYHVFATTADYSVNSFIAKWCFGGLHLHVVHHLSPSVCHTHYQALTKIIKPIAEKNKVNYRVNRTMYAAVKQHYYHLKMMSKA